MPADKTIDTMLIILVLGLLTLGLGSVAFGWLVAQWDRVMSRSPRAAPADSADESGDDPGVSREQRNDETREIPQWVANMVSDAFHSGENTATARFIVAETTKLTDAVKIGTGKRSGDAYSRRSKDVQAIVKDLRDQQSPQYRQPDGTTAPAARPVTGQRRPA